MSENIGIRLTELISEYVDVYLSEAETEEYPYAVYTSDVTPVYTKDGIHHFSADVVITIYAKDLDEVNPIAENIIAAIGSEMTGNGYSSRLNRDYDKCTDGIWSRELNYLILQK